MKKKVIFTLSIGLFAVATMLVLHSCSDREIIIDEPTTEVAQTPEETDSDMQMMSDIYFDPLTQYGNRISLDIDYAIRPEIKDLTAS